jgi:hypothetical protein
VTCRHSTQLKIHISMAKHCVPLATCAPAQGHSSSGVVKAGKRAGTHAAMWVVGGSAGGGDGGEGGSCSHPRTMSATSPFLSGVRREMRHCEEGQATRVAASMTRALSVGDGGCIGGEGEPEGRTRPVAAVVARLRGAARRVHALRGDAAHGLHGDQACKWGRHSPRQT